MLTLALHVIRRQCPSWDDRLHTHTHPPVPHLVKIRTARMKVRFRVLTENIWICSIFSKMRALESRILRTERNSTNIFHSQSLCLQQKYCFNHSRQSGLHEFSEVEMGSPSPLNPNFHSDPPKPLTQPPSTLAHAMQPLGIYMSDPHPALPSRAKWECVLPIWKASCITQHPPWLSLTDIFSINQGCWRESEHSILQVCPWLGWHYFVASLGLSYWGKCVFPVGLWSLSRSGSQQLEAYLEYSKP